MNGFRLKMIAFASMVVDHVGYVFFPEMGFMRIIGRLAFPIFAFLVAEGVYRTKDLKKYLLRMLGAAIVTEVIFDLAFYGQWFHIGHQNVMFTFSLVIAGYMLMEKLSHNQKDLKWLVAFGVAFLGSMLRVDHGMFGIMIVMVFILMRDQKYYKFLLAALIMVSYTLLGSQYYAFSALAIPLLYLYDNRQGIRAKYLFYVLYPGHLLVIFLIQVFLVK